ncbi:hypothetical protein C0992_007524 [Termitomyces sp. T32_za158]|nr:hypothetical protein C0992_007524 [Termitomyces sp. T32_za158]
MTFTEAQGMPCATNSKTLYTPIFYSTPSSSLSGSEVYAKPVPKAYLERMSKQHIALATKVQEVPSSRPVSPGSEERSTARVDALRQRVQEAYKYANGDPADGKWSAVVQLLRLNVTRRRRWLDTTTRGKMAESSCGWINAETEEEWEEWEAKWAEEDRVNKKVQNWQRDIEAAPVESASIVSLSQQKEIQRVPTEQNVLTKDKRATSSLGFPVVKRSSLNVVGKPKGYMKASANNVPATPSSLGIQPIPHVPVETPFDSSGSKQQRPIQDLSESSFLPPSFSQIDTSTPNDKTQQKHKPEPIIFAPPSESSPLPTPPSIRTYGRRGTMSTISERPSSPTQNLRQSSAIIEPQREKRARSVTPPQAMKKTRVKKDSPIRTPARRPSPPNVVTPITPTVTPQRAQLPRLIDLIASSKKAQAASSKRKLRSRNTSSDVTRTTVTELKALEKVLSPQPEANSSHKEKEEKEKAIALEHEEELEPEQPNNLPPNLPTGMYDYTIPLTNDEDQDDRDRSSVYNLIASPARSLSSLAASDSDSEPEDGQANMFNPPFTSTQVDGKEKALGWMKYNSQFDVDGNVDLVSKFMEKDVDVDFGGWLKDSSPEPVEEESQ